MGIKQKFTVLAGIIGMLLAVVSIIGFYTADSNLEKAVEQELTATMGDAASQMDGWLLSLEGKSDGAEQALKEISEDSETYFDDMLAYFDELLEKNQPEVIVSMYKTLPQNLQNDERFYYDYGYANYLMAFKCVTIIEKDIYNSRAADVFLRLKARGFVLEESLNCWLSLQ